MLIYSSLKHTTKNKEGLLQLLFDVQFLFEILGWRKDIESGKDQKELHEWISYIKQKTDSGITFPSLNSSSSSSQNFDEALEWENKVKSFIESLESQLDPIDLAFFKAPLKRMVEKSYQQTTILFGVLVQLNKNRSSKYFSVFFFIKNEINSIYLK